MDSVELKKLNKRVEYLKQLLTQKRKSQVEIFQQHVGIGREAEEIEDEIKRLTNTLEPVMVVEPTVVKETKTKKVKGETNG